VKILHTADWQLGKPFAGVSDPHKRMLMQQARIEALGRIADVVRSKQVDLVVVAGDLFDSPSVTKPTVSAACQAIGSMRVPVVVIPGNHDHGGPGSIWEQRFFEVERVALAPNLKVLLSASPVELDGVVLFPCPLLRRQEVSDPTAWLRAVDLDMDGFGEKPRVAVIHGSTQGFGGEVDEEGRSGSQPNLVDLSRIPADRFDYLALGDWHGTKEVQSRAWYAGTPELDRFPKGASNDPGHVLVVDVRRGQLPTIEKVRTGRIGWHELEFEFPDEASVDQLATHVEQLVGNRVGEDLLRLVLRGSLGIQAMERLETLLESWQARLLQLHLLNEAVVVPSADELQQLTRDDRNPLIARVAQQLISTASEAGPEAEVARVALCRLHRLANEL
jgi:DNA repair exonuclease SbcCD nuclease subunit